MSLAWLLSAFSLDGALLLILSKTLGLVCARALIICWRWCSVLPNAAASDASRSACLAPPCLCSGLFIISPTGVLRQITVNDLPVGRSVDETLRLVKAFQVGWQAGGRVGGLPLVFPCSHLLTPIMG